MNTPGPDACVLEIRTYRIHEGRRDEFDRLFREGALPLLRRFGVQVVGAGPSIDDALHYVLLRAYSSLDELNEQESAFYGSHEWRDVHREPILACIASYHTVVLETTAEAVDALARSMMQPSLA